MKQDKNNAVRMKDGIRTEDGSRAQDGIRTEDGSRAQDGIRTEDGSRKNDGIRTKDGIRYTAGRILPYGATEQGDGAVNFSVHSAHAADCTLVLYHKGAEKPYARIEIPAEYKVGDNYSVMVFDLDIDDLEYGYSFGGEYDPSRGLYFDREKVLLDPYARRIAGCGTWMEPEYGYPDFPMRGCVLREGYDWEGDRPLGRPMADTILYEMHVRGFSKLAGGRHPGTYAGIVEQIPYLKKLGVNCLELLPVFEFYENDRIAFFDEQGNYHNDRDHLCIYWGYAPQGFFAPKAGYACGGREGKAAEEFRDMVKALHRNGIEVVLDVVFNHTGEWYVGEDAETPFRVSFAGIDNPTYYVLNPDGSYADYTGCNNTLNCNHPVVLGMILDCLRYWVTQYHVDGFRFDAASVLTRGTDGAPLQNPPLTELLAGDPVLSGTKLIAEPWDAGGLYQLGCFPGPKRWAEWNGRYRDCVRRFLRSDAEAGRELILRLQGSPDIFSGKRAECSINFVTCHDGFTLMDAVSYNEKHNQRNGEQNRDGIHENYSWNCGAEGETTDPGILALRRRSIRNAQLLMMISRGTPMLLAGDEFGNSQQGNNNSWSQDNAISWLDWSLAEKNSEMIDFVTRMIALRLAHPVMRRPDYFDGYNATGYPEISFHGTTPWEINTGEPQLTFGMMYAESARDYPVPQDAFIYIGMNAFWESRSLALPIVPEGFVWKLYADTTEGKDENPCIRDRYELGPRSAAVLIAEKM